MKAEKRKIDLLVLSDIHLGTYGCHAEELLAYLKSIDPARIVLNGDIIDMWQFSKRYWPQSHMQVVRKLMGFAAKGIPVHYLTGNHDETMRKFAGMQLGNLMVDNKLVLDLPGAGKAWLFHGDVFDVTMQHARWLAKLGGWSYDLLILLNRGVNHLSTKMGRGKISLSAKIKNSVKSAVKFINNFERTAAELAIHQGYDFVVCGHIHQPEIREIALQHGSVTYLNSGDWIENLTALEFHAGQWRLFRFHQDMPTDFQEDDEQLPSTARIFEEMAASFALTSPLT
jgi:UDP-2,3-diacylglucosamine pyrophosphatase LpxH